LQTNTKIKKKTQEIAKLERNLALAKIKKRKAETRRKIEFGGLVVKANMDTYSKDIILGALIHIKSELKKDAGASLLYQSIGQAAFMEHGEYGKEGYDNDAE
jgi:hypothetical protein